MTDGMRTPEMISDPEADAAVQARITAIQDGIRQDPVAYSMLLYPLALSKGLTRAELPKDEQPPTSGREGTQLPLRQVVTYLGQRDDRYAEFDGDTQTALSEDPTYARLLQQLRTDHSKVAANRLREQLSVFSLLFFVRRVHRAAAEAASSHKA